jgi:type I restriction enzyme, S subunit
MSYWNDAIASTLRPLKHCCVVNPDILPENTAPEWEFDYIDIGSVSLSEGVIKKERLRFENAPSRARKPVKSGDILVSTVRTYLKAIAAVQADETAQVASTGFAVLRANQLSDSRFLFRVVQSNPFVEQVVSQSVGVSYPAINPSTLANIKIPLPDLATQRRIADFLDRETARIDLLIEKKQRLVALLPEKEKNEISRLVLRGIDPSVPFLDTGVFWREKVPAHWNESRLKAHFRIQKRQGFDDLEVLSVYREYGVIKKSSRADNINKTPEDLSKYQLVEPGDLVVNKMKAWQGSLGVSKFTGITSPDYVVMTPCGLHHAQYMHHLLRAVPMPTVYHLISNGIRTDQWRLEPDRFLSLPVFLPPIGEQKEIAKKVKDELGRLRNVADAINKSIDRLKEYRSALITAAVTGRIDVTTYAKSGTRDRRLDAIQEEMQT